MALTPGTRLGPYEILGPLGAGGMGEVHHARDTRLDRSVAIKTLPHAQASDPESLARLTREAKSLAALNHPNIAAIYGIEESAGTRHLVLEFVEGETLAERLARGPMLVGDALEAGAQIAAAVEAAHDSGIIHRDLKPRNVMLTASGSVKVLDFGLAKNRFEDAPAPDSSMSPTRSVALGTTSAGTILGTAAYMSPEQARGKTVDRRTDVWSFGCVLFEMLSGRQAFEGDTVPDLIARILEREPAWDALPPAVPAPVRELLRRCLRKEADARPRDIRDVRLELLAATKGGGGATAAREHAIAVLPFANLSGAEDEYFADGIAEEIMASLSRIEGLRVAARTSSFAFKGKQEDLRRIGEQLGVATVLEGSLRRSGNRLRITAQLVNVEDGYRLWSERYDRELIDVFAVQDEIAGAIASRLEVTLSGAKGSDRPDAAAASHGTSSLEAYELFLKGRALQYKRGRAIREAIAFFEKAIAIDPGYAEALAWYADSWRLLATYGLERSHEAMPKAREAATRALGLNPKLAEAWSTLADIQAQYDWDFEKAAAGWGKALECDPHHMRARVERAIWSFGCGRMTAEVAASEAARAAADDPLNAWPAGSHALILGMSGQYEASAAEARRATEVDPGSFIAHWCYMRGLTLAGRPEEALALAPALLASSGRNPWALGTLALTHVRMGNTALARAVYDEMEARSRQEFVSPFWLAAAAAHLGLMDEAARHARTGLEEREPLMVLFLRMAEWDPMRTLPVFAEIRERLGVVS
jgi:serine/threonine-protein kinase